MRHLLQEKIPHLFDNPSRQDSVTGIRYSVALAFFAVGWTAAGSIVEGGTYYLLALGILLGHFYVIVRNSRNLLFIFRYALLAIIPIGGAVAWGFFDDVNIAPFGAHYQTHLATSALVGSGMFAVSGGAIGWFLVFIRFDSSRISNCLPPHITNLRFLNRASLTFLYLFGLLTFYMFGGAVTDSRSYATETNSIGFEFNAANSFIFVLTGLYLTTARVIGTDLGKAVFIVSPAYVLPILAGSRADFLMQFTILLYVYYSYRDAFAGRSGRYPLLQLTFGALLLYFIASYIAIWRHVGNFSVALGELLSTSLFIVERDAGKILSLETANQMAGHFYVVYSKIELIKEPFLYGKSYLDFLFRTTPAFLGLQRPADLAWAMFVVEGETMAQGGVYEVAEAYWNFWYFGVLVVPMIISYTLGWFLKKALTSPKLWIFFASGFFGLGLMAPRAIWYQTFAYWRLLTVVVLLYLLMCLIKFPLVRKRL